ncbi:PP2C family protein-serine/threonine phosphatase [Actinophytocola algeriensis]|uniref:Protein phosphatase n=1 Tax=Actinophytocola algeriensis TaxID=1768010 RepID=A0A7W7VGY1_9PSEU|nr:serine/threonine protein phosphatase [Actinophytocola algeriensis]MBB4909841.1 protein phosphatase [Actinophytocola algeriensis]MBE1475831.1 protein phosphatase [Actinophytocola algeriensis]
MRPLPAWRTAGTQGPRTVNADAVATYGGVVALADGVGDSTDAARAARAAVTAAVRVPAAAGPVAALAAAQRALPVDGDCVLVVAQPYASGYHIGWVGDVRAYAWDGVDLWQLTRDHTLAQYVRDHGGQVLPRMEHLVTTSVRTAEHTHYGLTATGTPNLLLTTDGVHKTLTHEQMAGLLRGADNPADALVAAALREGTKDNTTAVMLSRAPALPTMPLPAAA